MAEGMSWWTWCRMVDVSVDVGMRTRGDEDDANDSRTPSAGPTR